MNKIDLRRLTSIDDDFALWSAEQAALIRAGKLERVDFENVAEEIDSVGRSAKYEIINRLDVLICHLLKWQFQPQKRSNSWRATIVEQRTRIEDVVSESPSLSSFPGTKLSGAFVIGRNQAITETGLPESAFPETCPYTIEQILDPDFFPGSGDEQ